MANFKWFTSLVLAATVVSTLVGRNPLPGKCRKCTLPPRQPLPDYRGGIGQPFRPLQLPAGYGHPDHDGGSLLWRLGPPIGHFTGPPRWPASGVSAHASFAQLDSDAGRLPTVANQKVLVYDFRKLQATDLDIQGVLGEDFLEHFDMLIDNAHCLLCVWTTRPHAGRK